MQFITLGRAGGRHRRVIDAPSTGLLAGATWKQEVEMKLEMGQGLPSSDPLSPTEAHYLLRTQRAPPSGDRVFRYVSL